MHTSSLSAAMYGVLFAGLAVATGGEISLSNFTPRIDNLPTKCKTVYDTKIDACVSSDFALGATCSSACVAGLTKIGAAVKTGCASVDVGETSIIGVFQNDLGIAALCPNNQQTTSSSSSSTAQTTLQTSTRTSTPVTTTAAPPTSTTQPSRASSSGLNLDTTATGATSTATENPTGAAPTLVTDPSSAPSSGGNSQLSNSDSGGGSPFDVVATGAAPQLRITTAALSTVVAAVLFVACV